MIIREKEIKSLRESIKRERGRLSPSGGGQGEVIPWQDPTAALAELERAVKELGLKGIKVDGTVKGEYLDSKKFWPIFKKAEELGTPIFVHVEDPRPSMTKFYHEYSQSDATTLGRDLDVCMLGARLISSGLFDECPRLNFIFLSHFSFYV